MTRCSQHGTIHLLTPHLKTGVHFQEVKVPLCVYQELHCPSRAIVDSFGQSHCLQSHCLLRLTARVGLVQQEHGGGRGMEGEPTLGLPQ